jgi:hypothetical protein
VASADPGLVILAEDAAWPGAVSRGGYKVLQAKALSSISLVLFVILVPILDLMLSLGESGALLSWDCSAIDQRHDGSGVSKKSADGYHFER